LTGSSRGGAETSLPDHPDVAPAAEAASEVVPPAQGAPAARARVSDVADGRERQLDPRWITAERIGAGLFGAVCSVAALVGAVLLAALGPLGRIGWLVFPAAWLGLSGALAALALGWPVLRHRHTAYRVTDDGLTIRRGVLWRSVISVHRSRVQHTDVSQGPVDRLFELATLIVYTAGTQHASISLGGLSHDRALLIRDHLIGSREDDAV
jgi:membrane protein YdbS with pleckstrin-like domain